MTAVAGQAAENAERNATPGSGGGNERRRKINSGEGKFAAILVAPAVLVLAVVVGYPLIAAIINSFRSDKGLDPVTKLFNQGGQWIGLTNWIHWLGQRCGDTKCPPGNTGGLFWKSTTFTFGLTIVEVLITTIIGLLFALMMNKAFKGRALVRAAILVPWAIPTAVTAKLWYVIFQSEGVFNKIFGLDTVWLSGGWPSRAAILIADSWKTAPFMALLILAGLQIIPADLYESAKVDGATAWQRFYKITLPLVKPALVVAVIFRAMDVMRMFDLPAILTGVNNPDTSTLSVLVYRQLQQGRTYEASALSTITFIFIFLLAFILIKALGADLSQSEKPKKPSRAERREAAREKAAAPAAKV
ncbi:carbohydrate ABC transporter permease [Jatrophihabitans sp. YIM 134969]